MLAIPNFGTTMWNSQYRFGHRHTTMRQDSTSSLTFSKLEWIMG